MTIQINGLDVAFGPSWDSLQGLVRSMVQDNEAVFTRISRRDRGANYRARTGIYDVDVISKGSLMPIVLTVNVSE